MTTLSWQPAKHSWERFSGATVWPVAAIFTCRICGARKRLTTKTRKMRGVPMERRFVSVTSTRLATKDAPDVWLPPAKVRCIHRGLRVLP